MKTDEYSLLFYLFHVNSAPSISPGGADSKVADTGKTDMFTAFEDCWHVVCRSRGRDVEDVGPGVEDCPAAMAHELHEEDGLHEVGQALAHARPSTQTEGQVTEALGRLHFLRVPLQPAVRPEGLRVFKHFCRLLGFPD